jgi:hypothetical protein
MVDYTQDDNELDDNMNRLVYDVALRCCEVAIEETPSLRVFLYGAPSKARNLTSYIYGREFLLGIFFLNPAFR